MLRFFIMMSFFLLFSLGIMANEVDLPKKVTVILGSKKNANYYFKKAVDSNLSTSKSCIAFENGLKLDSKREDMLLLYVKKCSSPDRIGRAIGQVLPFLDSEPSVKIYAIAVKLLSKYGAVLDAEDIALEGIKKFPNSIKFAKAASLILMKYDKNIGISFLNHILKRHSKNSKLLMMLGTCYEQTRRWREAYIAYSKAVHLSPKLKEAIIGRKRVSRYALVIDGVAIFPDNNQEIIGDRLVDLKTGEVILFSKISAKKSSVAVKKFVLKSFPKLKKSKFISFVEKSPFEFKNSAFAFAGLLEIKLNKHNDIRTSTFGLAFSSGKDQLIIGVRNSTKNSDEAMKYISQVMRGVIK